MTGDQEDRREARRAPAEVGALVKQFYLTCQAVRLYPESSPLPAQNAKTTVSRLQRLFERHPEVVLTIGRNGLFHDDIPVHPELVVIRQLAREFYERKLSQIRFHAGVAARDVESFCGVLRIPVEELLAAGGFEARLWELGVDQITVKEYVTKIVDSQLPVAEGDVASEEPGEEEVDLDALIEGARTGAPQDRRTLVRIVQDPASLARRLQASVGRRGRSEAADADVMENVVSVANWIHSELPGDQEAMVRSLAQALLAQDPALAQRVLATKLMPRARHDEALASVVRSMDLDAVCDVLVRGLEDSAESRDGLARAIRNLAHIRSVGRDDVAGQMADSMAAAGAGPEFVSAVVEGAAPRRLQVKERPPTAEATPVEQVLKLLDAAPATRGLRDPADPHMVALRDEAGRGIDDANVLASLVALAELERRSDRFGSVMALVEDGLDVLLEQGDMDVAADAARTLATASSRGDRDEEQRARMQAAMQILAGPRQMRTVLDALGTDKGARQAGASRRLLETLGSLALDPLIDILADEEDMATRKSLVDLLIPMVDEAGIPILARRMTDRRWYVVRNVVCILAGSRNPAALPPIRTALKHSEGRVRREALRALSLIRDPMADELLIQTLTDSDPGNVRLAARYLGAARVRTAVGPLHVLANGEGEGPKDGACRVEAVEALGRIAAPESLAFLEALARPRLALGSRRTTRELRTAARAAAEQVRASLADSGAVGS